jgi:hypothetical protein
MSALVTETEALLRPYEKVRKSPLFLLRPKSPVFGSSGMIMAWRGGRISISDSLRVLCMA